MSRNSWYSFHTHQDIFGIWLVQTNPIKFQSTIRQNTIPVHLQITLWHRVSLCQQCSYCLRNWGLWGKSLIIISRLKNRILWAKKKSSFVYDTAFPGETNTPHKRVSILITVCPQATLATVQHFWCLWSILCLVHKDWLHCLISAPNPARKSREQYTYFCHRHVPLQNLPSGNSLISRNRRSLLPYIWLYVT